MNLEVKKQILDTIKQYNKIIISRHFRPDGDAVGSALGLKRILEISFPEKEILTDSDDFSDYIDFLGEERTSLTDDRYEGALLIVLDCGAMHRLSNSRYALADKLIKIDHHVEVEHFGDISWVEDWRSSACEMVVDFYLTFKDELKLDKEAATALYTGMVTDSGRFRNDGTGGETLRLAAVLLDQGIDLQTIYARLYLDDYDYLKFASYVYANMQRSTNGVASIYIDNEVQEKYSLTFEQASNAVSLLADIKDCIVWVAFIDSPDGTVRVRLRSRFIVTNKLAEQYGGGGHEMASGANLSSAEKMEEFIEKADAMCREFKESNFYL